MSGCGAAGKADAGGQVADVTTRKRSVDGRSAPQASSEVRRGVAAVEGECSTGVTQAMCSEAQQVAITVVGRHGAKPTNPLLHKVHDTQTRDERYWHSGRSQNQPRRPARSNALRRPGASTGVAVAVQPVKPQLGLNPRMRGNTPQRWSTKPCASTGPTAMGGSMAPGTGVRARGTPDGSAPSRGYTAWSVMVWKAPLGRTMATE